MMSCDQVDCITVAERGAVTPSDAEMSLFSKSGPVVETKKDGLRRGNGQDREATKQSLPSVLKLENTRAKNVGFRGRCCFTVFYKRSCFPPAFVPAVAPPHHDAAAGLSVCAPYPLRLPSYRWHATF